MLNVRQSRMYSTYCVVYRFHKNDSNKQVWSKKSISLIDRGKFKTQYLHSTIITEVYKIILLKHTATLAELEPAVLDNKSGFM
jgi:hypothetical protein